ncbi:MAG: DUF1080 domain-containing protein [Pirellulaceae bacterium]|nr:DUF1080 domain-containing protein [Pirellulaceae bacterium]
MSCSMSMRRLSRCRAAEVSPASAGAVSYGAERKQLHRRRWSAGISFAVVICLASAAPAQESAADASRGRTNREAWRSLFDGRTTDGWEAVRGGIYDDDAAIEVENGCLHLRAGRPAAGVRWTRDFPRTNYELEFEAQRVEGSDFFGSVTFPVGDGALTLVLGGWGGGVVGLSCIDGQWAIDNETCTSRDFENGRWYRVRVRVTPQKVATYLDDKFLCGVEPHRRELSVRLEMEPCLPLGIATWNTTGRVRGVRYRELVDLPAFLTARPVWLPGRESEMNLTVGFRAVFPHPGTAPVSVRIAASTVYRVWLNGAFVAVGPARGPHGYYRVDELDLTGHLQDGANLLAVEVVGYNVNSYDTLDQPAFLQAEVVCGTNQVLAATRADGGGFSAVLPATRVQRAQRYSFQRPMSELYRLAPGADDWRTSLTSSPAPVPLTEVAAKQLLPRRVLLPEFELQRPQTQVAHGRLICRDAVGELWKDRALVHISPQFKGYREDQLESIPSLEIQQFASQPAAEGTRAYEPQMPMELAAGDYRILDLGTNLTGFLGSTLECRARSRCWFVFDEILSDGDVDFKRLGCVNLISYDLDPGRYRVESIEPYTLRYLKLICVEGACAISDVFLREYKHPAPQDASFACSDPQLNELHRAGVETFRQNTLDVFMDCPSRERAGWLCDSFFTARVAYDVTGTTRVERNFFENYLLPARFEHLPSEMLPMCYPADHYDGVFIPNWALWFVVQLEEYLARSGDRTTVESLRNRVTSLFQYFQRLENPDGLLEKLPGWVFVEWSAANEFVQDVNYPSNMLYAGALAAAGRMYNVPLWQQKAERLRDAIRQQAYDGHFFVDNALRVDGQLQVTRNRSEVGQYFAFYFDVATPATHGQLWEVLRDQFGPQRKETRAFWDVHVANSFIGNMLRFELLSRHGCQQQILDESTAYLLYMAQRTGTLWENDGAYASCNHGFASHIVHTLYRDVLGVAQLDIPGTSVTVRLADLRLDWCEGSLPTPAGPVRLRWERHDDQLRYSARIPAGYQLRVDGPRGRTVTEVPWPE